MELNYKLLDKLQNDAKGLLEMAGCTDVVFDMDWNNYISIKFMLPSDYDFYVEEYNHLVNSIVDVYETFLNMDEVKYIQ